MIDLNMSSTPGVGIPAIVDRQGTKYMVSPVFRRLPKQ